MTLNEILMKSRESTGLQGTDYDGITGIIISLVTKVEGLIIKNRSYEANKIDRFLSFLIEIGTCYLISIFFSIIFILFSEVYIKSLIRIYPDYTPILMIQNYIFIIAISMSIFLIAIIRQRSDDNSNIMTLIKSTVFSFRMLKNRILGLGLKFTIHLLILLFWALLFCFAIYILCIYFIPVNNIDTNGYLIIGALACTLTYIMKVELEKKENKRILTKGIFLILSYFLTLFISFNDFYKLEAYSSAWTLKIISIMFLFIFQTANIVPLAKDISKLVLKSVEKNVSDFTELYLNKDNINDIVVVDSIERYLLSCYNYIPDIKSTTITKLIKKTYHSCKSNFKNNWSDTVPIRDKVLRIIISLTLVAISTMAIIFQGNNYHSIIILLFSLLVLSVIISLCFAMLEGKSIKGFIISEIDKCKKEFFPDNELSIDEDKLENLRIDHKTILNRFIILILIETVLVIFNRLMLLLNIRITMYIILIYIAAFLLIQTTILRKVDIFNVYYKKFEPKHVKYKIIKLILRMSVVALFIVSFIPLMLIL